MLRHVVALTFDDDVAADEIDAIAAQLRQLPSTVPSIRSYVVGRDLGLSEGNAHLVVVGDFDDEAGYIAYRDDPVHRQIIEERILPALASRSAAQFEL
jgi:endonuclease/exonuclease/phosphatase family metal-dependent hydrolase